MGKESKLGRDIERAGKNMEEQAEVESEEEVEIPERQEGRWKCISLPGRDKIRYP